jgi:zinc/manganese transport system substrate-binding protein
MRLPILLSAFLLATSLFLATPCHARLKILAAESVYGTVAQQIAGPAADVTSVISKPAQDPHDFEATAQTARQVAAADLIVLNGLDYDAWMDRLLDASTRPGREVLRVSDLIGAQPGANPHLWYAPDTMIAVGLALTARLTALDADDAAAFTDHEKRFVARMNQVQAMVANLQKRYAGTKVTATEPLFGPMAAALGLAMQDTRFQRAVMNGTEPAAGDVAAIEDNLRQRHVRVLFVNQQVSDTASARLIGIAHAAHVPVVGITETIPPGTDYAAWMLQTLHDTAKALEQK